MKRYSFILIKLTKPSPPPPSSTAVPSIDRSIDAARFMTIKENAWQLLLSTSPDYCCFLTITYLATRYRVRLVNSDQNLTPPVEWSLES